MLFRSSKEHQIVAGVVVDAFARAGMKSGMDGVDPMVEYEDTDEIDIVGIGCNDTVREMLSQRDDIGTNHMKVTEQRGWGGYCFPKDTAAMLHTCKLLGYDFSTLRAAVEYNWSIRRDILDTPETINEVVDAAV